MDKWALKYCNGFDSMLQLAVQWKRKLSVYGYYEYVWKPASFAANKSAPDDITSKIGYFLVVHKGIIIIMITSNANDSNV